MPAKTSLPLQVLRTLKIVQVGSGTRKHIQPNIQSVAFQVCILRIVTFELLREHSAKAATQGYPDTCTILYIKYKQIIYNHLQSFAF